MATTILGGGSDPDGDALSFAWTLVSRPTGSTAGLGSPSSATTSLVPDVGGQYRLRLAVSDGSLASEADEMIVDARIGAIGLALANPGLMGVGRQNTLLVSLTSPAPRRWCSRDRYERCSRNRECRWNRIGDDTSGACSGPAHFECRIPWIDIPACDGCGVRQRNARSCGNRRSDYHTDDAFGCHRDQLGATDIDRPQRSSGRRRGHRP